MAAVSEDTPTEPCPISEGDRFREGRSVLEVVEIVEHAHGADCRIESTHPTLGTERYRRPLRDVRRRVRRGCWDRTDR
ncbi:hypothetical protein [Halococcus sp. AFM35]|uniref:hypothetical protein n=1 Tax=Halococcus sp. AFM35 TaxID=3421653 RepID=UPI003EBE68F0